MSKPLHIGIIAGEPSGDVLAAGLIRAIKLKHPNCVFSGIGGRNMLEQGMQSIVNMEELSVMGLVEVLGRLSRLIAIKKQVLEHFQQNTPDIFIGVDAPDFNLRIETALKLRGIKTVHYVSPTVWAWRENRIHKIAKATNLVLGLFPFEAKIYKHYKVPYQFVGHTLADSIAVDVNEKEAREHFALTETQKVLALLPGSRRGEVDALLDVFLAAAEQTAAQLCSDDQKLVVLIPAANQVRFEQIHNIIQSFRSQVQESHCQFKIVDGQSRECLIAADAVLIASGTATLEAMLCKRPMVVAYKMAKLTRFIMGYMYKPKYFALPNLLANDGIVTELLQEDVTAEKLTAHLLPLFGQQGNELKQVFTRIHKSLKRDADSQAAEAVLNLIKVSNSNE